MVFTNLHREPIFILIIIISMGMQAIIVELGGEFTKCTGLVGMHWLYTIAMALITFPLGVVMRFLPVCDKPSDYADYAQRFFYEKMNRELKEHEGTHPATKNAAAKKPLHLSEHAIKNSVSGLSVSVKQLADAPSAHPGSPVDDLGLLSPMSPAPSTGIELQSVKVDAFSVQ